MNVKVDFTNEVGKIKPEHCVNNGPLVGISAQKRSNFDTYKAARIPYARTHDASEWIDYGGEFVVDLDGYDGEITEIYTVDAAHNYTLTDTQSGNRLTVTMKPNTFVVLKNK